MMGNTDVIIPALSAAGGGLTVGWMAKLMIQNWLKKHDDMASLMHAMTIQLTRVEERVSTLQRMEERTQAQDRALAVMQAQITEMQGYLDSVQRRMRETSMAQ